MVKAAKIDIDALNDFAADTVIFNNLQIGVLPTLSGAKKHRRSSVILLNPDGGRRSVEGHQKILMALKLKDPDLCERIMREHIQEAKKDALQSVFVAT
jgi:DNA-binding GntR family transcriptional regulator